MSMEILTFFLLFASAAVILSHIITVASRLSRREWSGHRMRYLLVSGAYSLIAGGAVGAAMMWQLGCEMLLVGVALLFLAERRGNSVDRGAGRA